LLPFYLRLLCYFLLMGVVAYLCAGRLRYRSSRSPRPFPGWVQPLFPPFSLWRDTLSPAMSTRSFLYRDRVLNSLTKPSRVVAPTGSYHRSVPFLGSSVLFVSFRRPEAAVRAGSLCLPRRDCRVLLWKLVEKQSCPTNA
jgi:hypothetical protein